DSGSIHIDNQWPIWIFPTAPAIADTVLLFDPPTAFKTFPANRVADLSAISPDILVASTVVTAPVLSHLARGGRVLLFSRQSRTHLSERVTGADDPNVPYPLDFAPTFWG